MFNFQNIGGKIKTLAVVATIIGISLSVILGFVLMDTSVGTGMLVLVGGSLFSWISAFFMYGFGELIEKTTEIANNTKKDIKFEIVNETETKEKTDE
jgi:hypothetical protein